jgi:hypothetical protein
MGALRRATRRDTQGSPEATMSDVIQDLSLRLETGMQLFPPRSPIRAVAVTG